jgi:hypothetical protein
MRCEKCQGRGYVKVYTESLSRLVYEPCPDCHGSGITYCCEGTERWSGPMGECDNGGTLGE